MKLKKIITCTLAACLCLTAAGCNTNQDKELEKQMLAAAPDYSKYTHQYDFYGYSGPSDGYWTEDEMRYYAGEDFRTVEGYKDYKDAGMTIYLPQTDARVSKGNGREPWSTFTDEIWQAREDEWAASKVFWDRAYEAGLNKIIMTDTQIQMWSETQHGMLVRPADEPAVPGEESPYVFESEAELDAGIAKCLETYIDHPGFYGVMLCDEPGYASIKAYGQVYRAIKRVAQNVYHRDIFVQHNLLPMRAYGSGAYNLMPLLEWFEKDESEYSISKKDFYDLVGGVWADEVVTPQEQLAKILEEELVAHGNNRPAVTAAKYEKYVEGFALSMGSDYIQFDDYPLRGTEDSPSVMSIYIREMQVVANVAKKLGINYYMVTQSFATTENDVAVHRVCSQEDCYWLNNTLLAFGVSQISYYTYWAKSSNATSHFNLNEGAFVTRNGEKTDIYYYYQQIMAENQKFAPVKLNFKYQGSRVYNQLPLNFNADYLSPTWVDNTYVFQELKDISVNKESVLITESYDSENQKYMYCVQNIVDAVYKGSLTFQTTTLTFDSAKYKYVAIYRNGERTLQALDNGKVIIKNAAGQAAFVIPY